MKRKFSIVALVVAVAVLASFGCIEVAQSAEKTKEPTYEWRLGTQDAKGVPLADSAYRFAEKVAELSNGDIKITVYPSSQLGDYTQMFEEVQMGTIDMAWISASSAFDPMIDIQGIPYMVENWTQARKLWSDREGYIYNLWESVMDKHGVTLLGINPGGFLGCGGKNFGNLKTVMDPTIKQDALLRVPAMELAVQIVKSLGYRTTTIPYGDLYSALQTGVADGWYGGSATLNYQSFRDVISIFIDYNYLFEICGMFMNQEKFKALPEKYQDLLIKAAVDEQAKAFAYYEEYAKKSYKDLEEYGIKVLRPTDEEMMAIANHVRKQVYPQLDEMFGADVMKNIINQIEALNQ